MNLPYRIALVGCQHTCFLLGLGIGLIGIAYGIEWGFVWCGARKG